MPISSIHKLRAAASFAICAASVLLTGCPGGGGGGNGSTASTSHGQPSTPGSNAQQSTNWSGYLITGGSNSFNRASATWVVPAVQCNGSTTTASSTWTGVGGGTGSDPTLIQAGTEEDCNSGSPSYYAWWEALPAPSNMIGLPLSSQTYTVNPGDQIKVTVDGSSLLFWSISIQNFTRGWTYNTTVAYLAAGSSVEWIQEAPQAVGTGGAGQAALSNFGRVSFTSVTSNGANPNLTASERVVMVDSNASVVANPSNPGGSGDSFDVCYGSGAC